ncbi:peptidoglycan recognition family protein [Micromonospora maris]|nr:peptidoglycan recognition family protein [Micromonospora maris]AEB45455.1 N-acetylmuramoyl-L-alanine amidase family 2 [Micromonospora maris AB-18-032]
MVTRRNALAAGAFAAAALPLTAVMTRGSASAESTPTGGQTAPRTLSRRAGRVRAGARVSGTSFPVSHLGVRWASDNPLRIRFRTTSGWASWQMVNGCDGGHDDAEVGGHAALISAPLATSYELDAGSADAVQIIELNTVDGPRDLRLAGARRGMPIGDRVVPVRYLSRAAWGADESLRFNPDGTPKFGADQFFPVQTVTVHHTAGQNDDPDPAGFVRGLYQFDLDRYGDLGYHLMIDEAGTVYEGRASGSDSQPMFGPAGADGRPLMISAAHVGGMNSGNLGIALLGDFTSRQPTAAARSALTKVLAGICAVQRLDPRAATTFVNPVSGAQLAVDTISGHRDWMATECPGNAFYPKLPALRKKVASLLR